jgi:hypothetical protein
MPPPPATPPPPSGPPVGTGMTCLKPGNGMYNNPGPYKVAMMEVDLGMIEASQHTGKFTIYYPNPLEADCLHPIVVWGNGTGVTGSGTYAFLNSNAARAFNSVSQEEDNTGSAASQGWHRLPAQVERDSSSKFYKKLTTRAGVWATRRRLRRERRIAAREDGCGHRRCYDGGERQGVGIVLTGTADV